MPAIASRNAHEDTLTLIDPGAIAYGEGPLEVRASRQAVIEMKSSSLTQDATTGTGTTQVSLWQANAVGILLEQYVNWKAHANAVAILTGISSSGS